MDFRLVPNYSPVRPRSHRGPGASTSTTDSASPMNLQVNKTRSMHWIAAALLAVVLGCGEASPLLGEWEVDARETTAGVLALVRRTGDALIVFEPDLVRIGSDELPIRYEVEASRVHLIRTDRDFVHEVDLLEDGRIRVHFPGGYSVVYQRASS